MGVAAKVLLGAVVLAACGDAATPVTTPPTPTTTAPTTTTTTLPPSTTRPEATTVLADNGAGMTVVGQDESAEGENWALDVLRPALVGHPDPVVAERVNAQIDDLYDATVDGFWRDLGLIEEEGEEFRYDVSIAPEVTLFDEEVLSLRFHLFWSSSTAAHPTDDIETVLVGLATGEPYTLPDLLSADSAPQALLALIDRHLLEDVLGGDEDFFDSVVEGRDELNFGVWALTPATFDVSYGRYEAGPGVLGSVTVSIPYEELGVLVNPAGPIARLAAS